MNALKAFKRYPTYLLALLMVIEAFNFLDRIALGVVLQNVKVDLGLSDTELGLLTGLAFAAFYSIMGIPLARWADRGDRVNIISGTASLWSVAVGACALAANFAQLLLIRVVVGVGEAGCKPPALSLIADNFPRADRARAVSRYELGWPIALLVGYLAAGWINQLLGWRAVFLLLGLPGIIPAILAFLTLREPRRAGAAPGGHRSTQRVTTVFRALWANSAYRNLLFAMLLTNFFTDGIMQWQPAFFIRSYGLRTGELGTWLALVYGCGGLLGTYLGGEFASRWAGENEGLQLRAIAIAYALFGVMIAAVYLVHNYVLAFSIFSFAVVGGAAGNGPIFAATQSLAPPRMRAMSVALILFFSNLVGTGLGPLAIGALSDTLHPLFREESLRYTLVAFCPGYFWCAWHLWKAGAQARAIASAHVEALSVSDSPDSQIPLYGVSAHASRGARS